MGGSGKSWILGAGLLGRAGSPGLATAGARLAVALCDAEGPAVVPLSILEQATFVRRAAMASRTAVRLTATSLRQHEVRGVGVTDGAGAPSPLVTLQSTRATQIAQRHASSGTSAAIHTESSLGSGAAAK